MPILNSRRWPEGFSTITREGYYQWSQISPDIRGGTRNCVSLYSLRSTRKSFLSYIRHPCFGNRLLCDVNHFEKQPRASSSYIVWWSEIEKFDQSKVRVGNRQAPILRLSSSQESYRKPYLPPSWRTSTLKFQKSCRCQTHPLRVLCNFQP